MRRREFISLLGGATATWAFAAHAQQKTPLIGYMGNSTAALEANLINAFREGLREAGYEEGRNVTIKYLGPTDSTTASRRWFPSWLRQKST